MTNKQLFFPKLVRRHRYSRYRKYSHYRKEIREDCQGRCVYCDVHENEVGGEEYMTLDHFRPKDKYPHLQHNPRNLLWACSVCNRLKDNIWPAYLTSYTVIGEKGFIDPFEENVNEYLEVLPNGKLQSLKHPGTWLIETLILNRTGAKKIREARYQKHERKQEIETFYEKALKDINSLLENVKISPSERETIINFKIRLDRQYKIDIKECEHDFNLYQH